MKVSRVETCSCLVGESALWDAEAQALYFLDIVGQKVHRYDPASGATRSWATPGHVGAMALRACGGVVLAMKHELQGFDFESGAFEPLARLEDAAPETTVNDGKADRNGRFLVGLSASGFDDPQPIGGLYSLGADHRTTRLDGGVRFSNSPCFSPDGRTLYFADSYLYSLYAYDYDPATGAVANKRLFVDTRPLGGMPDGATVDAEGRIWMALFRAGQVGAFRPDGGLERLVDLPVKLVSSVAFGGRDLDQLYVTSLDPSFFKETPEPGGGDVFVVEGLGVRGLPEARYAG
jgi:sugar lactone lactonase YvrE